MAEAAGKAPRAFVAGFPIAHSRSPVIHGTWLEEFGIEGAYEALAVAPDDFASFLSGLGESGYVGGNVTIPHKEAAFARVARRDAAAAAIGAVNTLWFEDGRLVGGNTDSYGFSANLDERLAGWRDGDSALVLGAGGAARAVVHALAQAGFQRISVVNRSVERALALAASFGPCVSGHGLEQEAALVATADLIVNTRPGAGSGSPEGARELDLAGARPGTLATDIVYVPLETPFLSAARANGLRTADGLGMLLHQAVPGFERWFGRRPVVSEALRARIERDILNGR